MSANKQPRTKFAAMVDGTPEEWGIIMKSSLDHFTGLPDRVLAHMEMLRSDFGGFAVDRLEHSLQTATRAAEDGRDDEYVVCALLHDIGDTLGPLNHAGIAAAILQPFVVEQNYWMVDKHGIFQGYYFFQYVGLDKNLRDQFKGHEYFDYTEEFCRKYDQCSFDSSYKSMLLSDFEPALRRVLSTPKSSIYLDEFGNAPNASTA